MCVQGGDGIILLDIESKFSLVDIYERFCALLALGKITINFSGITLNYTQKASIRIGEELSLLGGVEVDDHKRSLVNTFSVSHNFDKIWENSESYSKHIF